MPSRPRRSHAGYTPSCRSARGRDRLDHDVGQGDEVNELRDAFGAVEVEDYVLRLTAKESVEVGRDAAGGVGTG